MSISQLDNNSLKTLVLPGPDASYIYEYDSETGHIDFMSKKKMKVSKAPQRVLSVRGLDDPLLCQITSAFYMGQDVPISWLKMLVDGSRLDAGLLSITNPANDENSTPRNAAPTHQPDHISLRKRKLESGNADVFIGDAQLILELCAVFFGSKELAVPEPRVPASIGSTAAGLLSSGMPSLNGPKPFLVSIEGNIGAGKSTLLKTLRKNCPDWTFIDEPVDTWTSMRNDEDVSLLELFYGDQRRWSYTFQNCALLSRFQNIENTVKAGLEAASAKGETYKVFVTERCLDTDHEVFAKMLRADRQIDKLEMTLYERWFNLLQQTATPLSAIIWVDTDPETCVDRIKGRARDGEESIPLAYLQALDNAQRTWIESTAVPKVLAASDMAVPVEKFVRSLVTKL